MNDKEEIESAMAEGTEPVQSELEPKPVSLQDESENADSVKKQNDNDNSDDRLPDSVNSEG